MKNLNLFKMRSLLTLLLLAGAGCVSNPVTGKKELHLVSEAQELQLGAKNYAPYQQAQGGAYVTHPEVTAYVQQVGNRVAAIADRKLPYEFTVLNNSVPNAWALPGGKIAVNRGLLTELDSEAELAAVLGHEIIHAAARHSAKSMERGIFLQAAVMGLGIATSDHDSRDLIMGAAGLSAGLLSMKYSRGHELEADDYGIKYMVRAGYDPAAAVELQETFVKLSGNKSAGGFETLFATHPPSQERVNKNREHLTKYPSGGYRGESEYRVKIDVLNQAQPAYKKMEDGYKALQANKPGRALQAAQEALRIEPREALFHGLAAKALQKQNKLRPALQEVNRALALNGNYYEFYLQKGQLQKALGDQAGSRISLQRSVALLPTATAHEALGRLALASGQQARGLQHLRMAADSTSPAGLSARQSLARIELPTQPGRYLPLRLGLDRKGRLLIEVQNHSGLPVADLRIQVAAAGQPTATDYRVGGTLMPGKSRVIQTSLGPFASATEVSRGVRARVRSARIVE